ncbi:TetR family transcriptional regulator [Streptomyces sp. NPDC002547]
MAAEAMGLRERKKRQTALRIYRTAIALFAEKGFDAVSVQEIADDAEVSKMTVFNYFGSKEDLVFKPMVEHFSDAARAVRDRACGESAVDAVRRQFLEMVEGRDPSVGLHGEPFARRIREVIMKTPELMERACIGVVDGDAIELQGEFALSLEELRKAHEETIPALLA